jgi:hypothetical protein
MRGSPHLEGKEPKRQQRRNPVQDAGTSMAIKTFICEMSEMPVRGVPARRVLLRVAPGSLGE